MKKTIKIILCAICALGVLLIGLLIYLNALTLDAKLDTSKLINPDRSAIFYDADGNVMTETASGVSVTPIEKIPTHTKNAFISIEDKRFYTHNGIDIKGLVRAAYHNLKSASFKEGGSTITQQLIKNTHLSNEKTLKRKMTEIKLALEIEKKFTKDEILEKYLNTIYFGDNCYGITAAAMHYFNKSPEQLNVNESAALAGMVKAPSYYSPSANIVKCNERKNLVLKEMCSQNYLTKSEYSKYIAVNVEPCEENIKIEYDYLYLAKRELNDIISKSPYDLDDVKIYTHFDPNSQEILKENLLQYNDYSCNLSAILLDAKGNVVSYFSTCGDTNRQIGSAIKPIAVYAPAIQNDIVNSYTVLNDEKTDFNGYSPSNYNDKYYGKISVKDSLAVSSNVCAVRLLNYVGTRKAVELLKKIGFEVSESDATLALALGACEKGVKLSQLAGAYTIFTNGGKYRPQTCINTLSDKTEKTIYRQSHSTTQVIDSNTAYVVSDMLKNVVENGTAKKLSTNDFTLYAKTGTVGNKDGNTDAYVVSYNSDYVLAIHCSNKDDSLMSNTITGGTIPTSLASVIWSDIYKGKKAPSEIQLPNGVSEVCIDKLSYEQDGEIILSDKNAPERFKMKAIFKNSALPKVCSTRFSIPVLNDYEISVNYNSISIKLCLAECCGAKIFRRANNEKILVFDTNNGDKIFTDKNLTFNSVYTYIIVPYYESNGTIFYGKEIILDKIKTPNGEFGDDWWSNEFE